MFYSSLQAAISHSIYSNVNLKVKQVICLEAIYYGRDVVAVLPLLSPDIAAEEHLFTYRSTWNLVWFGDNTFRTPVVSV